MLRRLLAISLFVLFSTPAFASQIAVVVDISEQVMKVWVDGHTLYTFDVSTGRKGHTTPTGHYAPIRMYAKYHSKKYDNAPMPYAIFFHGGFAIHGTTDIKHLGKIASHGCVRLHPDNAKLLFGLVQEIGSENTSIVVRG